MGIKGNIDKKIQKVDNTSIIVYMNIEHETKIYN